MKANYLLFPVICGFAGCANLNSIYRPLHIGSSTAGQAISVDIKQRAVFSMPRKTVLSDGTFVESVVVCAEPSPDSLSAYGASAGLGTSLPSGAPLQSAGAASESAGSVGLRTQSIQLLRDQLFANCMSYLGGAAKPNELVDLQRRSQNITLGVLAIEQLTGAVKADQVALNTSAAASTGTDDLDKETSTADEAKALQNESRTELDKSKLELSTRQKAVSDQQAKVQAAQKSVSNLPKDASEASKSEALAAAETERATLETLRKEAENARIEMDSKDRAARNADQKVIDTEQALLLARGRVRSGASGTSSIYRTGGAGAISAAHVSNAVVSIVNAVLAESGRGEQCNALLGRLSTISGTDEQARAVAAACSRDQAETVQTLLGITGTTGGAATPQAEAVRKAFENSNIYRAPMQQTGPSTRPAPAPPPAAPR